MTTFADWYAVYPRKKSRADAQKAWSQALNKGFSPDEIMAGLKNNLDAMKRKDPQFVPYPATWLRAEAWADEPDPIYIPERKRTLTDAARDLNSHYLNAEWAGDTSWDGPRHLAQNLRSSSPRH